MFGANAFGWIYPAQSYAGDIPVIPDTPLPVVQQGGGANLGLRGPTYPDRTPEQVLREEEEILVMI